MHRYEGSGLERIFFGRRNSIHNKYQYFTSITVFFLIEPTVQDSKLIDTVGNPKH